MVSPYSFVQKWIAVGVSGVNVRTCVGEDLHNFSVVTPYRFQ